MDTKDKMIGIIIGIRFSRSFRVSDIAGEIIDDILYSESSPFGVKFFPQVQETSREKVLVNNKTSEYLRINRDDLILGLEVKNNFNEKFSWFTNEVLSYFKDRLFPKYGIKNIIRIGIVFSHKLEKSQTLNESINILTKKKIGDVGNINISFSKKLSAVEALYRKNVSDYKNTIYNLTEIEDSLLAELDYQYYYTPPIEDLRQCFSEKVFDDAKVFLENHYYPWLTDVKNQNDEE